MSLPILTEVTNLPRATGPWHLPVEHSGHCHMTSSFLPAYPSSILTPVLVPGYITPMGRICALCILLGNIGLSGPPPHPLKSSKTLVHHDFANHLQGLWAPRKHCSWGGGNLRFPPPAPFRIEF